MSTHEVAIRNAAPRAIAMLKSPEQFEREATFAGFAVSNNTDLLNLAKANPQQLTEAVLQAVASGVSLNPALGLAYLVPRAGKIRLEFGYQGYIQLATASGSISDVFVETVHQGDAFKRGVRGSQPYIDHEPGDGPRTAETMTGVYCITTLPNGRVIPCYMSRADVDAINTKSPPWKQRFLEMAKKTVIRRARKTWPRQIGALETAFAADQDLGRGESEPNPLGEGAIDTTAELVDQETGEITDPGESDAAKAFFDEMDSPLRLSTKEIEAVTRLADEAKLPLEKLCAAYQVETLADIRPNQLADVRKRISDYAKARERRSANGSL